MTPVDADRADRGYIMDNPWQYLTCPACHRSIYLWAKIAVRHEGNAGTAYHYPECPRGR